jgi:hypothetical protein
MTTPERMIIAILRKNAALNGGNKYNSKKSQQYLFVYGIKTQLSLII